MKDQFTRKWILETGIPIVQSYGGNITLRALHYRLVASGMTNSIRHYKRVIAAMTKARWDGLVDFDDFRDHERQVQGSTKWEETVLDKEIESSKDIIKFWLEHYLKNRWENQPIYPEVWIEKKALQGVFEGPCQSKGVALCPCKGYPSLTFLYDASLRFVEAQRMGKSTVMLYFGDYDPSGEDIPRSIEDTLAQMGVNVEVKRIALMEEQVIDWNLPPAPAKSTDSRTANWDGLGQVELDAVEPRQLQEMIKDAIGELFDDELYEQLQEIETEEREKYQKQINEFVKTL